MAVLPWRTYVENREQYDYHCQFDHRFPVIPVLGLDNIAYAGIYSGITVQPNHHRYLSIRQLEKIVQAVFKHSAETGAASLNNAQKSNLKNVSAAIVYWKMASQGGRAGRNQKNVLSKWDKKTTAQLVHAYQLYAESSPEATIAKFQIKGVRIPTASAFLRFLFPVRYGIVDSRVVNNHTNNGGWTKFKVRDDGYIIDTAANRREYDNTYTNLLRAEADWLNQRGVTFNDPDPAVTGPQKWRPCDVEMALWK